MIDGQLQLKRKARFDKERQFYLLIRRYGISRVNTLSPRGSRSGQPSRWSFAVAKGGERAAINPHYHSFCAVLLYRKIQGSLRGSGQKGAQVLPSDFWRKLLISYKLKRNGNDALKWTSSLYIYFTMNS